MSADRSAGLEATRLLAGVDVHPTSLPASAVLLVRRMADPAPGFVNMGGTTIHPSRSWTRALQRAVDCAARDAVRPAAGPVPPSAPAVLFLDPAELLACLARDFLRGEITGHWWWQAWLRAAGRSTLDLVLDAWTREARAIPAAIAALQRQDLAAPFVRALSSAQIFALIAAVAEAYECPFLIAAARPHAAMPAAPREPTAVASAVQRRGELDRAVESAREPRAPVAPWERVIPSVRTPASLPIQRLLLGVTLSLWHAPLVVRTREFQRALQTWRRDAEIQRSATPDDRGPDAATSARADVSNTDDAALPIRRHGDDDLPPALVRPAEAALAADRAPALDRASGGTPATQAKPSSGDAPAPFEQTPPRAPADSETANLSLCVVEEIPPRPRFVETPARYREHLPSAFDTRAPHTPQATALAPDASSPRLAAPAWPRVHGDSVATELGGVLFLANVLESLRFFDCLDDHFRVESSIGAWGWLEIVARCLLGREHGGAAVDPLWDALGRLDGRAAGVAIAPQVRVARDVELPRAWARPARMPRMRVRPLGFDPAPDLRRLLGVVMPYIRWRLLRALDIPLRRDAPLASRLCYRRGRLEWTATHVDLHMEMSAIDIAVRLAGLDANPGWVPAFGRVVTFHFD